jgi:hypothetical protein
MKAIKSDLLTNVVGTYDQTKTTVQGRAQSQTVNSTTVLGPPTNKFIDTVADSSGLVIPVLTYLSPNFRLFSIGAEAGGVSFISLHTINSTTLVKTFVGQIRFSLPDTAATTHTLRSIKVLDTGTTGWKIFITTSGSVLINGGTFLANKVDQADFIPVGSTLIPFATADDQKAVYDLQDPSNIGVNQLQIASVGSSYDPTNNRLYVHNGVSATHQMYAYSTTTAPTYATTAVSVSVASPGVVTHAAHTFLNNDPVVFTAGTLPTGLVVGTVYFVRNSVAGVSYELSATTGGASINTTGSPSVGAFIGRAFGTTGSNFVHKTGNLPALAGTLLANDSEDYALPGHTTNSGFDCVFFATSTNLYLGKMSELTSGAVAWASLVTSNLLGTSNQITTPTATQATWSNSLDKAIYITNTNIFVMKEVVNNVIYKIFGGSSNVYRETFPAIDNRSLLFLTSTSLDIENGVMVLGGSTTGQRGVMLVDLRSDASFDYSYIVTKVLDSPNSVYKFIATYQELVDDGNSLTIKYRTSGFGSVSGGWTSLTNMTDLSGIPAASNIQFKILFNTLKLGQSVPAQLKELFLGLESNTEISDYWEFSDDFSDNTSPSRSAFRLKKAYTSSVPTLYYRAYDLSDALLVNHNTVTNIANFEYSTTNGVSWVPMGTIPNTVGTLIRYSFTSPPGVDIRPSIKEA